MQNEMIDKLVNSQIDLNEYEKSQLKVFITLLHDGWSLTYARSNSKTLVKSSLNTNLVQHPLFLTYIKKYSRVYNSDNRKTLFPKTNNYKKKVIKLY